MISDQSNEISLRQIACRSLSKQKSNWGDPRLSVDHSLRTATFWSTNCTHSVGFANTGAVFNSFCLVSSCLKTEKSTSPPVVFKVEDGLPPGWIHHLHTRFHFASLSNSTQSRGDFREWRETVALCQSSISSSFVRVDGDQTVLHANC